MNIKILVATHKKYWMPSDDVYLPIHVGREGKEYLGYIGDNTGKNISGKNANYCELTGLYWAWKNLECDYIGLCHYRRYFSIKNFTGDFLIYKNFSDIKKFILKEDSYVSLLEKYDVILPKKTYLDGYTTYEYYKIHHNIEDLNECEKIINNIYPEYIKAFKKVMMDKEIYLCNMFVMNTKIFNDYMKWVFTILFKLEKRIDISNYDNYQARVFGFLSERLFNVYIENKKNNLNIHEIPIIFAREVSYIKYIKYKAKNFLNY